MTQTTIAQPTQADIADWLIQRFAGILDVPADQIDATRPFVDYHLDSAVAVTVTRELGAWLSQDLPITLFWEYPNIDSLSAALDTRDTTH